MSLIVKPGDTPPPATEGKLAEHVKTLAERRSELQGIIKKHDDQALWDAIQAKDVPAEITEYVMERLEKHVDSKQIRKDLGIPRATDKAWRKIMASIRQGFRVDATTYGMQILNRNERLSAKIRELVDKAMNEGIESLDKNGNIKMLQGLQKEILMATDALNRLDQGTVKVMKELGIIQDAGAEKSAGGVTIVVNSNIPLATPEEVRAKQELARQKNEEALEKARAITAEFTKV